MTSEKKCFACIACLFLKHDYGSQTYKIQRKKMSFTILVGFAEAGKESTRTICIVKYCQHVVTMFCHAVAHRPVTYIVAAAAAVVVVVVVAVVVVVVVVRALPAVKAD